MEKILYIEDFILFSPQQYIVVWHKDAYTNNYNYTLQKQNLNYIINDNSVTHIETYPQCNNALEKFIHSLFFDIQSKIISAMYKVPSNQYYSQNNQWFLVWSVLYKKDKIDSFYNTLRKEPLILKALLDKILSKTKVHYTILDAMKENINLMEIYKLDIEFITNNYNFNITFHLYDITTKEFYKRILTFNFHPDEFSMQKYSDKVIAWHNKKLDKKYNPNNNDL
jgi:hypothetical protein